MKEILKPLGLQNREHEVGDGKAQIPRMSIYFRKLLQEIVSTWVGVLRRQYHVNGLRIGVGGVLLYGCDSHGIKDMRILLLVVLLQKVRRAMS
jgi:hypothetical protein